MNRIMLMPYYGGKYRMVTKLSGLIPKNSRMYELFGGSGALTLNYSNGGKQVINEKNKDIYCLWEVMKDREMGKEFIRRLSTVEYSRKRFDEAKGHEKDGFKGLGKIEKAVEMFVLATQSFNSLRESYSDKNKGHYKEVNATNVTRVYNRMAKIEISNEDAVEMVCSEREKKEVFLFLDPPYLHRYRGKGANKAYGNYEMEDEMHEQLLKAVVDADCKVMICGYRGKDGSAGIYDGILGQSTKNEWKCYLLTDIKKPGNSGGRAKEYIWVNYELPARAKYEIDIGTEIKCREQALPEKGDCVTMPFHGKTA